MHIANKVEDAVCKPASLKLLILVPCHVEDGKYRKIIRDTWARMDVLETVHGYVKLKWRVVFVIGAPQNENTALSLTNELHFNKDLLLVNLPDLNSLKTLKLMVALEWVTNSCVYEYLLVMNEPIFFNIPAMFLFLHWQNTPKTNLFVRNIISDSLDNFNSRTIPTADAFLVTSDVLSRLIPHINWDKHAISNTDTYAYVNDLVSKANVVLTRKSNFLIFTPECRYNSSCALLQCTDINQKCIEYLYKLSTLMTLKIPKVYISLK